ncbi:MAG: pitrilysin family protein, partial [Vicinamibacterales bacterium]
LADLICNPLFLDEDIEREKKVILEEIKMVEDTPDDLVHELFAEGFWNNHPLGRPILGTPASVSALDQKTLRHYFSQTYVASNFVVVAVGNLDHDCVRDLLERALVNAPHTGPAADESAPVVAPVIQVRKKELEQSHIVFGTEALPQHHPERYAGYALNTTLGGSMSSRLFQNVREKRGLAYSVFSGLSAYQDAGALSIYAGCANEAVAELIDVVVAEIRMMKADGLAPVELRRAKDHLKGSLMLGLESTSSRMSHLARQEMYRDQTFGLDEMLAAIEAVTEAHVLKLADRFFTNGSLAVTVLGNVNGLHVTKEQLAL